MKTDLEKFKELFDSVGIKYEETTYEESCCMLFYDASLDNIQIVYYFNDKGKLENTGIMFF